MKKLHILNGDATRPEFEKAGIEGDIVIWREMLVEGPAVYPVLGAEWQQTRFEFIRDVYGANEALIHERTSSQWEKLADLSAYEEIVLWFEYDLFCQINMIAALSGLYHQGLEGKTVSLVCPGEHPSVAHFRGLGQLGAAHFVSLFAERETLTETDIAFADKVYRAYAAQDPRDLIVFVDQDFPAAFPFLKRAIQNHLNRFPEKGSGLSKEEKHILSFLEPQPASKFKWVGAIMRNEDGWIGYGDLQYFHLVERLSPLFEEKEEAVVLNETGKAVLAGERNFFELQPAIQSLGGARNDEWTWENGQLIASDKPQR